MPNLTPEQQAVIDEIYERLRWWFNGYVPGDLRKLTGRWMRDLKRTGLIQPKEE